MNGTAVDTIRPRGGTFSFKDLSIDLDALFLKVVPNIFFKLVAPNTRPSFARLAEISFGQTLCAFIVVYAITKTGSKDRGGFTYGSNVSGCALLCH